MQTLEAIGQVLWTLLITCGILLLAYWFTRRVAGQLTAKRGAGGRMEVLEQLPLGRDQKLVLARVGQQLYLLGVSPAGVSCLRTFTEDEAEPWLASEPQPGEEESAGQGLPFREALRRVLEQRSKR